MSTEIETMRIAVSEILEEILKDESLRDRLQVPLEKAWKAGREFSEAGSEQSLDAHLKSYRASHDQNDNPTVFSPWSFEAGWFAALKYKADEAVKGK